MEALSVAAAGGAAHATIGFVKIRKKGKKSGAPRRTPVPQPILPGSSRDLKRPKIDAFCAKITALHVVDDDMVEPAKTES